MASLSFFPCTGLSDLPSTSAAPFRRRTLTKKCPSRSRCVRAAASPPRRTEKSLLRSPQEKSASSPPATRSKKPVYSMKKGQIVRVDKEKYLNSINYLSVGHPPYFKGLDYIYEDRGEVLDLKIFETGSMPSKKLTVTMDKDESLTTGFIRTTWGSPFSNDNIFGHSIIVLFGHDRTSTMQNPMQIAWVGIPTAPAWLPTDMLIKSEKLNYERM